MPATVEGKAMDAALRMDAHGGRGVQALGRRLSAGFSARRVCFALVLCLLVSTSVLFQPHFYRLFVFEQVARAWLDYFGECLIMTVPIVIALTAWFWPKRDETQADLAVEKSP
jgi:hypothetical protein